MDTTRISAKARNSTIGGVRILAGLMWLANIHWKVPNDFGQNNNGGLYKYVASGADHAPFALFRWILREIVMPQFQLFGWIVLVAEIALAALLLIGYRTQIVALVGAGQAAFIGLTVVYYERTYEWAWSYLLMIGMHLLLWAVAAGHNVGVDGVLEQPPARSARALPRIGAVAVVIGLLGLFVARSIDFAGRQTALLGSDAGFVNNGKLERRWELKFMFFNPLWALLTILFGALLIVAVRSTAAGWAAAGGFAVIAVVAFVTKTFDYVRDDGAIQKISTGSDVAVWAGFAVAAALLVRRSTQEPAPASPAANGG